MKNWDRGRWFDETGLPWINPSPNMRNLLQATAVSRGRGDRGHQYLGRAAGTDTPFEQIGAPWIDGVQLAEALNAPQRFPASVSIRCDSRRSPANTPRRSARACSWS